MKILINWKHLMLSYFIVGMISVCCKNSPASPDIPQIMTGSWRIYTPFSWDHDGEPYDSAYCIVYSDSANYELKVQMGLLADEKFNRILNLFGFSDFSDFKYPPGNNKIEIYINRSHSENIAWAYWGGFIITIRSSSLDGHWYNYAAYTAAHELTHVFEFLIEGREILRTDVWFKEGIAVHTGSAESTIWQSINNLNELESWISNNQNSPGQGNPIKIHQDGDYPPGADTTAYYKMFELALRYLLDQRGMCRSYQDALNLFYDMRKGDSFSESFKNHFGISLGNFEKEFYNRMRNYLSNGHYVFR